VVRYSLQQAFADLPSEQIEPSQRPDRYETLSAATKALTAAIEEWATIDSVFACFNEIDLDRKAEITRPAQLSRARVVPVSRIDSTR
jgi:hypothetical protein